MTLQRNLRDLKLFITTCSNTRHNTFYDFMCYNAIFYACNNANMMHQHATHVKN